MVETDDSGYRPAKKTTMGGLPLTNPTSKMLSVGAGTSAVGGKKDPYADMGSQVLTADKRANGKQSSEISSRSFLMENNNGTVVSSDEAKGVKGSKNPYSEMGVSIDFPEKKSATNKASDVKSKPLASPISEHHMQKKTGDPYADVGTSSDTVDRRRGIKNKKGEKIVSENAKTKADISALTANLNQLLEKAKQISKVSADQEQAILEKSKDGNLISSNLNKTTSVKDPYADVGSLVKKSSHDISGSKKDLDSAATEEFENIKNMLSESTGKSLTRSSGKSESEHSQKGLSGLTGKSVASLTSVHDKALPKQEGSPLVTRKKDPYADVGSAVNVKDKREKIV